MLPHWSQILRLVYKTPPQFTMLKQLHTEKLIHQNWSLHIPRKYFTLHTINCQYTTHCHCLLTAFRKHSNEIRSSEFLKNILHMHSSLVMFVKCLNLQLHFISNVLSIIVSVMRPIVLLVWCAATSSCQLLHNLFSPHFVEHIERLSPSLPRFYSFSLSHC